MYVKYDSSGKIESLFIGCAPSDGEGYAEIPDDRALADSFVAARKTQHAESVPTDAERIAALEEQLAAAKILLGVD